MIEKVFTVAATVERAWHAFADGTERSKWEAATYEIDARPGGAVRWTDAGCRAGDLVLRLAGVPVYSITDTWVLMRLHTVGSRCTIEYVRDGEVISGEGTVTSWDVMSAA